MYVHTFHHQNQTFTLTDSIYTYTRQLAPSIIFIDEIDSFLRQVRPSFVRVHTHTQTDGSG